MAAPDSSGSKRMHFGCWRLFAGSPTVSAEGRALETTAGLVEELLAECGFETRQLRVGEGPAAAGGVAPVRADASRWEAVCAGVVDNKGELAVRLTVIRSLRERSGELPISIRWIIEGRRVCPEPAFR